MSGQIDAQGWWSGADRTPSPHRTSRSATVAEKGGDAGSPPASSPWVLVIHCASLPAGQYGTGLMPQLLQGRLDAARHPGLEDLQGVRVSAHLWIDREGGCQQFVSFDEAAWHAGESSWGGRDGLNACSIGVELEGCPPDAFADAQYERLAEVAALLLLRYPDLTPGRILGHTDIAPMRKDDPGPGFDWRRFLGMLRERLEPR